MLINSKDYHDYIFKNGKFIGEFEQMYQKIANAPWHQDTIYSTWVGKVSVAIASRALEDCTVKTIHDVGCGLGYFIANFKGEGRSLSGSDISQAAIRKAKGLFSDIDFYEDDIIMEKKRDIYDFVLMHGLIWHLVFSIEIVAVNLANLVRSNGYLYVGESFPRLDKDFFGKKIIPNPDKLLEYFSPYFHTIVDTRINKAEYPNDGPNLFWLGRRKT